MEPGVQDEVSSYSQLYQDNSGPKDPADSENAFDLDDSEDDDEDWDFGHGIKQAIREVTAPGKKSDLHDDDSSDDSD